MFDIVIANVVEDNEGIGSRIRHWSQRPRSNILKISLGYVFFSV